MGKKKLKTSKKDLPDDDDAHVEPVRPTNDPLLEKLRKYHIERDPRYGATNDA